jgi:hypothetical protein
MCHAAMGRGRFVFIFLKNFQFFKKIKTNPQYKNNSPDSEEEIWIPIKVKN